MNPGWLSLKSALWTVLALALALTVAIVLLGQSETVVTFSRPAYAVTLAADGLTGPGALAVRSLGPAERPTGPASWSLHASLWPSLVGQLSADSVILDKPLFVIRPFSDDGEGASQGGGAGATLRAKSLETVLAALAKFRFKSLKVVGGTILVQRGRAGTAKSGDPAGRSARIEAIDAEFSAPGDSTALSGRGSFSYNGERLAFDIDIAPSGEDDGGKSLGLELKLAGTVLTGEFKGQVALTGPLGARGALAVKMDSLARLLVWLGQPPATARYFGKADITGTVMAGPDMVSLDEASFKFDANSAQGTVSLDISGARPRLDATLAFETLGLETYLGAKAPETGAGAAVPVSAPGADRHVLLAILRQLDADIRISAKDVTAHAFKAGDSAVTLSLRSGKLLADVAEMQFHGGTVTGQLNLDTMAEPMKVTLRGELEHVPIEQCFRAFVAIEPMAGTVNLAMDLVSQGDDLANLLQNLKGDAHAVMTDGGSMTIDLKNLIDKAGKQKIEGWGSVTGGAVSFADMKADVVFRDAVAFSETLSFGTDEGLYQADASINLATGSFHVRLNLIGDDETKAGRPTILVMKGPWQSPIIDMEYADGAGGPAAAGANGGKSPGVTNN